MRVYKGEIWFGFSIRRSFIEEIIFRLGYDRWVRVGWKGGVEDVIVR